MSHPPVLVDRVRDGIVRRLGRRQTLADRRRDPRGDCLPPAGHRYCCFACLEHIENSIRLLPALPNAPMFFAFPDDPQPVTLGADKGYDSADFVRELRDRAVTPHVAQNTSGRRSAIDGRTTRHPGYALSQRIRKRVVGRVPLQRPSRPEPTHNNATIRPTDLPMDCQRRAGPTLLCTNCAEPRRYSSTAVLAS